MTTVYPDYYPRFRCIADKCRHSCCIGWEIDIDTDTLERYDKTGGETGARLRRSIEWEGDAPHFRLLPDGRCPFLNDTGLCDIILSEGEGALCQICTDHPRFRSFFSTRTELGVGLCCEAAAELILGQKEKVTLVSEGETESLAGEEQAFLALRHELMGILQNRAIPVAERAEALLTVTGGVVPLRSGKEWAALLRPLERLDPAWDGLLDELTYAAGALPVTPEWELPQEQLLVYFLYRHFSGAMEDGDIADRAAFAVMSWRIITALCTARRELTGGVTPGVMAELARAYSAEIEYSDENTEALLDWLYEQ